MTLVQFIVTTHSPIVISSAGADELIILDGSKCMNFSYEVYGKAAATANMPKISIRR